ncbi:MAG: TIM barrel protein [Saprospiraceae bacterium]
MDRRNFVKNTLLTGTVTAATGLKAMPSVSNSGKHNFQLKYAPHDGMFKNSGGADLLDQIRFMADEGFTAFEDNDMGNRDVAMQEKIGNLLDKLGMEMGVFVAHKIYWREPNLASGKKELRDEFLNNIKNSVDVAKRCGAKWMTVVPGYVDLRQNPDYQTAHVVESLRQASEILEPHGLVMVLEPLNFRNHPGLFLTDIPQAYQICRAVNSPSCKILYDLYHIQIQHGDLIPNIDLAWSEIAYFQIGDNPGRNEPTTGEINYKNVFKHIHEKGFTGILGMEHGNSGDGVAGERAVIDAYKEVDSF